MAPIISAQAPTYLPQWHQSSRPRAPTYSPQWHQSSRPRAPPTYPNGTNHPGLEPPPTYPNGTNHPGLEPPPTHPNGTNHPGLEPPPTYPNGTNHPGLETPPTHPNGTNHPGPEPQPTYPNSTNHPGLELSLRQVLFLRIQDHRDAVVLGFGGGGGAGTGGGSTGADGALRGRGGQQRLVHETTGTAHLQGRRDTITRTGRLSRWRFVVIGCNWGCLLRKFDNVGGNQWWWETGQCEGLSASELSLLLIHCDVHSPII